MGWSLIQDKDANVGAAGKAAKASFMIGWVQQCMWEEWHASDVIQHRAHPAQRWLGSRWHRPIAAVV